MTLLQTRNTYRHFKTFCRHIYGHLQDIQRSAQTLSHPYNINTSIWSVLLCFLSHKERCNYLDVVFLLILSVTMTDFVFCFKLIYALIFGKIVCKALESLKFYSILKPQVILVKSVGAERATDCVYVPVEQTFSPLFLLVILLVINFKCSVNVFVSACYQMDKNI